LSQHSLEEFARNKLRSLERRSLKRSIAVTDRIETTLVERDGRKLVSFSCNDYLGLAMDPETIAASVYATGRYGAGAGAPRLTTGSHSLYADLEQRLARLKDTEDAVVFGSGYLANIGIIPVIAGKPDLILIDELAHSCMLTGAALSGATVVHFAHNDPAAVAQALTRRRAAHRHCLILTEGVFSMDGDLAPLPALARLDRPRCGRPFGVLFIGRALGAGSVSADSLGRLCRERVGDARGAVFPPVGDIETYSPPSAS
jgi:8-amino-7-oxononanoate synthase